MPKLNSIKISKGHEPKMLAFSKLNYLRERWDDHSLKLEDIKKYNDWSSEQRYKIIMIELRLEQYLTENILVDLKGNDNLFSEEMKETYFTKDALKHDKRKLDSIIGYVIYKNNDKEPSVEFIERLSFGKKIILWRSLNPEIFKHKYMGIESNEQSMLLSALNNIRYMRNGIAHMNSRKQIMDKMHEIDGNNNKTKEQSYKDSLRICNKMKVVA